MERSCAFNFVFFPCIKMENSTNRNSTGNQIVKVLHFNYLIVKVLHFAKTTLILNAFSQSRGNFVSIRKPRLVTSELAHWKEQPLCLPLSFCRKLA